MANLQREKSFQFKEKTYKVEVPTVGQYLDIENAKLAVSKGYWTELIKSQTVSAAHSIQIIECVAILSVLCPDLFNDMKVADYKDIDVIDFMELVKVYIKEISPWYYNWFKSFNEILTETNKIVEESNKKEENNK